MAKLADDTGPYLVIKATGRAEIIRAAAVIAPYSDHAICTGSVKFEVGYGTKFFNLKELNMFGPRNATSADFEAVVALQEGDIASLARNRDIAGICGLGRRILTKAVFR